MRAVLEIPARRIWWKPWVVIPARRLERPLAAGNFAQFMTMTREAEALGAQVTIQVP